MTSLSSPYRSRAKIIKFFLILKQASLAAIPFRSDPEEAAVGDVFGTLDVDVAETFTRSKLTPNSLATT